jgi:regulator of protease activity HflC (stomatin/prohibitin superfamily)
MRPLCCVSTASSARPPPTTCRAEGEQQAAQKLLEAAEILAARPEAMQLRYLGTLGTIGAQNSATIVFPFPMDLADFFVRPARG